ncbi:MAG: phenylalanine--tRNA ligase subunit alpha [Candidatus Nealsonbacteria bacterium]|nr:phenylalanine--tRNA ligase subunit alpha [Candidatus Nealsonbacteria bacterium]
MTEIDLKIVREKAEKEIRAAQNRADLERIFHSYLGKRGQIALLFKELKDLSEEQRRGMGQKMNELKKYLEKILTQKKSILARVKGGAKKAEPSRFDLDRPGRKPEIGHLHPLTQTKREIMAIFASMGFVVAAGPEMENEWYNFDALNIPKDHPARDAWSTIWIKSPESTKLLLRTHTSPVQARYLEAHPPPLRIIVPGKVFRYEATDASHESQFYQLEGLMVDKKVSAASFKAVIAEFMKRFFGKNLEFRLRPDFFPFTEPSFDVAMTCLTCSGRGCPVCKKTGWLEVAGAGLVHPNVLRFSGLNPEKWQGWAFGFGWDRLAMMKYKIDDIRLFNSGNLRFLEQF